MTTTTELDALYAVANDNEVQVLDELALRAGIHWQCRCRTHNTATQTACEACGEKRS